MATIDSSSPAVGPKTRRVIETFDRYVVPNYRRFPVCLVKGEGSRVWDAEGGEYLDLFPGWGCNLLGHCPEPVVRAVQEQVARLIHVPNTWYTEPQGEWAKLLAERSFGGQAAPTNGQAAKAHTPRNTSPNNAIGVAAVKLRGRTIPIR